METLKEAAELHQKQAAEKALEDQFKNPADIPTKGRVTFGEADAPITIVEFSSFQCGYCARASKTMKALREKYEGKVNVVVKHFPLGFPFAKPAAEYFEAIALIDHEKAKQFHDEIFDNFSDYSRVKEEKEINASLKKLLKKVDIPSKKLKDHLKEAKQIVEEDIKEGEKLKVRGTPSFFVNGIDAKGRIEMVINRLLEGMEE